MPQIGPLEVFVVAAVALIVFGPQKLPEMARSVGRFMSQVRRMASDVKSEFESSLEEDDDETPVADEDTGAIDDATPKPTSED